MNECMCTMCSQRSAEGVRALRTDCLVFTQVLTWALHSLASALSPSSLRVASCSHFCDLAILPHFHGPSPH